MDFEQRSYSGEFFRPRPLVDEEKSTGTLIVATSWGDPGHAQMVVDLIKEQLSLGSNPEATRVGTYIPELSEVGNDMRTAALFANEQLYRKENAKEYNAAVEIALVSVHKNILSWVQLGTPHLLLHNQNGVQALASSPDWAWQLQQDAPLVSKALGLEKSCYPHCGSHRLQGNEKVLMIARSAVPPQIYSLKKADLNTCSEALVQHHSDAPFWLGVLKV